MKRFRPLYCALGLMVPSPGLSQTAPKETAGPTAADYEGWTLFADSHVGFKLPVPPGIKPANAPEAAGPSRFVSDDGAFVMTAWGGFSSTPLRIMEWQLGQARTVAGRSVSTLRKDLSGFVIAGADRNGTKFFQKLIIRGDRLAMFTLTYPQSRLRDFDALVPKIEAVFLISSKLPNPSQASALVAKPPDENLSPQQGENIDITPPPPRSAKKEFAEYLLKGQHAALKRDAPQEPAAEKSLPAARDGLEPAPPKSGEKSVRTGAAIEGIPVAVAVPGEPGFVYSPYQKDQVVDAVDLPRGTRVKCPYTGRIFKLP
jgi:hypothetical protein